jgi:hypothetical protein
MERGKDNKEYGRISTLKAFSSIPNLDIVQL